MRRDYRERKKHEKHRKHKKHKKHRNIGNTRNIGNIGNTRDAGNARVCKATRVCGGSPRVTHLAEGDHPPIHEVIEAPRGGDDDVASGGKLHQLGADVGPAVHNDRLHVGVVAELAGLHVDLTGQLSGGGEDDGSGHTPPLFVDLPLDEGRRADAFWIVRIHLHTHHLEIFGCRSKLWCEEGCHTREQEGEGLARALQQRQRVKINVSWRDMGPKI